MEDTGEDKWTAVQGLDARLLHGSQTDAKFIVGILSCLVGEGTFGIKSGVSLNLGVEGTGRG